MRSSATDGPPPPGAETGRTDAAAPVAVWLPLDFSGALRLAPATLAEQAPGAAVPRAEEILVAHSFGAAARLLPDAAAAWRAARDAIRAHHRAAGRPKRREILACGKGPLPAILAGDADVVRVADAEDAVRAAVGPRTAGILVRPVSIEGGLEVLPGAVLAALRELADDYGIALLFDESDAGLGRTGMAFAHEWAGVTPDLMLLEEGGGLSLAALVMTAKLARALPAGLPVPAPDAVAAADAQVASALAPGFEARIQGLGWMLEDRLARLRYGRPDLFAGMVGTGLAQGLVCTIPADALAERLAVRGLLVRPLGGASGGILAVLPPLSVTEAHIAAAGDMLDAEVASLPPA